MICYYFCFLVLENDWLKFYKPCNGWKQNLCRLAIYCPFLTSAQIASYSEIASPISTRR
jgi:hypothetical protein